MRGDREQGTDRAQHGADADIAQLGAAAVMIVWMTGSPARTRFAARTASLGSAWPGCGPPAAHRSTAPRGAVAVGRLPAGWTQPSAVARRGRAAALVSSWSWSQPNSPCRLCTSGWRTRMNGRRRRRCRTRCPGHRAEDSAARGVPGTGPGDAPVPPSRPPCTAAGTPRLPTSARHPPSDSAHSPPATPPAPPAGPAHSLTEARVMAGSRFTGSPIRSVIPRTQQNPRSRAV